MTPAKYKTERQKRGTQAEVANLLAVRQSTISRREQGKNPITLEAWKALLSLTEKTTK